MVTACYNLEENGGGGGRVARKCHDIYACFLVKISVPHQWRI